MPTGETLHDVARRLMPDLIGWADWQDIWQRQLRSGVALEWATLAALVSSATAAGWHADIPLQKVKLGASLFTLRNEIPTHHGGQPGHAAGLSVDTPLAYRFLAALTPKLVLTRGSQHVSVFREGCPYHAVMSNVAYQERADIVLVSGTTHPNLPRIHEGAAGQVVKFGFAVEGVGDISGELDVRNSPTIPCRWRKPEKGCVVPTRGLVECSVDKSAAHALRQTEGSAPVSVDS